MRKIVISSVLLAAPLALGSAFAQDEGQQTQDQQQQSQQTQQQTSQPEQEQSQYGQPAQASTQASQSQQQASGQEPDVERAQFTSRVQDHEPVDEVSDTFKASDDPLYFFTQVKGAEGQTITHRWKYNGEVKAEVPLQIGSSDWRTYSSKELMPGWDGEWTVEVVDANGKVLEEKSVNVESQAQNVSYSPDESSSGATSTTSQQDEPQSQDQSQEEDEYRTEDIGFDQEDSTTDDETPTDDENSPEDTSLDDEQGDY